MVREANIPFEVLERASSRITNEVQMISRVVYDVPEYTADVVATGVLRVLEAVRVCGLEKTCRIYQASTSELYGKVKVVPQILCKLSRME